MKSATMLYRCPGPHKTDEISYDYTIVDADEVDAKLAEGWHLNYVVAHEAMQADQAKLEANERELAKVDEKLAKLKAVHKGRGVYELHDEAGNVVESGLTREQAQARA